MGEELFGMFCLLDDKGVIHIPEPDPGRIEGSAMALASKSSINRLATNGVRNKKYLRAPSPIYDHANTTGHSIQLNNFSIVTESQGFLYSESMTSLYRNLG